MARKVKKDRVKSTLCRMPADVVGLFSGLAWANGVSIFELSDTVLRDLVTQELKKAPAPIQQKAMQIAKRRCQEPEAVTAS